MKTIVIIFSVYLLSLLTVPASNDSLIKFSDLPTKNNAEKQTLKNYQEKGNKADIIDLFLTHYSNAENYSSAKAHELIMNCVSDLTNETNDQDEAKKVKTIYKQVHKRFFKVYKLTNSFSDVFEKGEYNCVSGSALYAIIFHLMGIPYQIVEAPQHVFLFAYPNTHKIAIETTLPQKGYFTFNEGYVEKFVNYLYESKLITKEEYESESKNQLFEKYYFETKGLSIQELAAIQYSNYMAYYLENNENEKALDEIKKAYYIHPSERNKYLLQSSLGYCLSNHNYKEANDIRNLTILCRINNCNSKEVSNESIKYEFGRLTQEQLITNSSFDEYTRSFNSVYSCVTDSSLKSDISFHYHYEMARLNGANTKVDVRVVEYLKAAYREKPKHADLRNMIKSYFARGIENENSITIILERMDSFSTAFGFLTGDPQFNSIKANLLLEMAYQRFTLKDAGKGEQYLHTFELLCATDENIKPGERFVEQAYSAAAAYYYKKGNSIKTRQILKAGLKHAPENFGLQLRLNQAK